MIANHEPQANKSFLIQQFFKNAGEVWASSPHLRSKLILQSVFPAAIAIFETSQFGISCSYETSYKFGQGNGAIAARWQAKAGVEPPLPDVKDRFSQEELLLGKPIAYGSAESLCCLPVCCSTVVVFS